MMVMMKSSNRWLGLLGAAVILSSAGVLAYTSADCDNFEDIGNGYCNDDNNNAECAYDGGDCCSCTCVATTDNDCIYGFACIDPAAACVDDDDITVDHVENCRWPSGFGNNVCDHDNNKAECGYDGGDCCSCTCGLDGPIDIYSCSEFACIDPEAECVDDDDITVDLVENCRSAQNIGNGFCDADMNIPECDYDAGDCCSCTCEIDTNVFGCTKFNCLDPSASCYGGETTDSTDDDESMSYDFIFWGDEEPLPTVDGAVDVGTKTEVGVSATAYDVRPSAEGGCGEAGGDGCAPANSRDGVVSEIESRWSCATKLMNDEEPCQIEYTFGEPQDIVDIQVAFWKGDERIRTLDVHLDGMRTHTHESYAGSTFNTLGVEATGVSTVMLESVGLLSGEWISLIEVLIFVTP